jgi:LemA protein
MLIILAVLILMTLSGLGWGIGRFNMFRIAQQDIKTQWSNIKTEYQRRADMFMNLVEATKSYKLFEKETLIGVTQARQGTKLIGSNTKAEMKKLNGLDAMFQKLMVVFERYPKLKSNEQHNALMKEVRITEDRINIARTDYNRIVNDYNVLATTFPANIIAGIFRFETADYFENDESSNKAPKIDLR